MTTESDQLHRVALEWMATRDIIATTLQEIVGTHGSQDGNAAAIIARLSHAGYSIEKIDNLDDDEPEPPPTAEQIMSRHPMQPVELVDGIARFKQNKIVRFLLDTSKTNLNDLAIMPFSNEDRVQLAQLIGYSVSGFGDLSYAPPDVVATADAAVEQLLRPNASGHDGSSGGGPSNVGGGGAAPGSHFTAVCGGNPTPMPGCGGGGGGSVTPPTPG